MGSAIGDVVSGALFYELRMTTLANNIANVSTSGFKEDRVSFKLPDPNGSPDPSGTDAAARSSQETYLGNPVHTYTNFSAGHMVQSGNPLDVAINGNGFFVVNTPDGMRYTRDGNFTLNSDGLLVTAEGFAVMGDGGEISLDGARVDIDGAGNITADGSPVDRLKIVDFPQQTGLIKAGGNTFVAVGENIAELEAPDAVIVQGATERSNVDAVQSMTEMIEALRGYESYQKVIQFLNEADQKLIEQVGRAF